MASTFSSNAFVFLYLMLLFSVSGALGVITCDSLDRSKCAYSVSSSGTRCVLEKRLGRSGHEEYMCRSSKIEAGGGLSDWIESDECVEACGADRDSVGISSDFLWDTAFTRKLCADRCYKNCPNIVDLYFNIAAGEENKCSKEHGSDREIWCGSVSIWTSGCVIWNAAGFIPSCFLGSSRGKPGSCVTCS